MSWIQTKTVHGSPGALWNIPIMPLDEFVHFGYLGLEIYRSSADDPSPSTCKVLVGRTLIPFRKENNSNKQASYELRMLEAPARKEEEGSITMVTEVERVYD